jgi:CRP-like cAMP-binding protein
MIEYFKRLNILSEPDLRKLSNYLIAKSIPKKGFLIKQGQICNEVSLIKSGILRSFYVNHEGEEITNCIAFEDELMAGYTSFITQEPTEENIQALTDTELITIAKSDLTKLFDSSIAWQKAGRILAEIQYIELEKRKDSFQKQSAAYRLDMLFRTHPKYIKLIPLNYLASFLGISTRHLSRLRKEVNL